MPKRRSSRRSPSKGRKSTRRQKGSARKYRGKKDLPEPAPLPPPRLDLSSISNSEHPPSSPLSVYPFRHKYSPLRLWDMYNETQANRQAKEQAKKRFKEYFVPRFIKVAKEFIEDSQPFVEELYLQTHEHSNPHTFLIGRINDFVEEFEAFILPDKYKYTKKIMLSRFKDCLDVLKRVIDDNYKTRNFLAKILELYIERLKQGGRIYELVLPKGVIFTVSFERNNGVTKTYVDVSVEEYAKEAKRLKKIIEREIESIHGKLTFDAVKNLLKELVYADITHRTQGDEVKVLVKGLGNNKN